MVQNGIFRQNSVLFSISGQIWYFLVVLRRHFLQGYHSELKSHTCGELCAAHEGCQVRLRGFLQFQRMGKFGILRDSFGLVQILIDNENLSSILKETPYESYIEVIGEVNLRPVGQENKNQSTGEIEVHAYDISVLNKAQKELPFFIRDQNKPTEKLGLENRFLDLRQSHLQRNLRFRSKICKKMRDFLQDHENFVEITTPTLSAGTPGGAQEFIVPSRIKGHFYSLCQSPQMYKQLAVIGGFEKYFQFAVCYRDEEGKAERQPEFMQLDLELSDVTVKEIRDLVEKTLLHSWPESFPVLSIPFPSITYENAILNYGTDKPDTRFEWKIVDVTACFNSPGDDFTHVSFESHHVAKAFVIPEGKKYLRNSHYRAWKEVAINEVNMKTFDILAIDKESSIQFYSRKRLPQSLSNSLVETLRPSSEDAVVIAYGTQSKVLKLLGKLRLLGAEALELGGVPVRDPARFDFVWVVDFPLFEWDEDERRYCSCHHPFTAPDPADVQLIDQNPVLVKSLHYDLVLNGCEIGGGSIRIHDPNLQRKVFDTLGIDHSSMQFLLKALSCGAPPHGGIALGLDRYISLLLKSKSIRDVIAFPKSSDGRCLLTGAPSPITAKDKTLYHI